MCKNNGVIYENQLLQIGLKSEYRQNLGEPLRIHILNTLWNLIYCGGQTTLHLPAGRIYVFYGNKTSTQFLSFSTSVTSNDVLNSHILWSASELFQPSHCLLLLPKYLQLVLIPAVPLSCILFSTCRERNKYTSSPKKKSRTLFRWTAFSFYYNRRSIWNHFSKLLQCHSIYLSP